MSDSEVDSVCTYYSSSTTSILSGKEDEYDVEEENYEFYDDENDEYHQYEVEEKPTIEAVPVFPKIDTSVPKVNPWSKKADISLPAVVSFTELLKEQEIQSKEDKKKEAELAAIRRKYENRPNFNFSNTYNQKLRRNGAGTTRTMENSSAGGNAPRTSLLMGLKKRPSISQQG